MANYYGQIGDFLVALRRVRDNHTDRNAINAWNRIVKELPHISATSISDNHTDQIIEQFREQVSGLAETTVKNYSLAFRGAVRRFMEYVDLTGSADLAAIPAYLEQTDPDLNLEEDLEVSPTEPEEPDAEALEEDEEDVKKPTVKTYTFLLRPGLDMKVPIPDDITDKEVKRFATWLSTYVVSSR